MIRLVLGIMIALAPASALAAPLSVRVVDSGGKPVRDAVVTVRPAGASGRPVQAGKFTVAQRDMQFHPFVLVVPVGSQIAFPNRDSTKHHVYSFSPAKRFELKLFARGQSRSVRFDKVGVVAVGCNIHDQMKAFIVITDSPWTSKTDARGIAQFDQLPAKAAKVTVWHPYLRAPSNMVARAVAAGQASARFAVRLRPPPIHGSGHY